MKKTISFILALALLCTCLTIVYAGAENIALGKPTFASSIYNDSYPERNVNDGSLGRAWASGLVKKTGPKGGYEYIAVDLESEYIISRIIARSRRDMERAVDRTGWLLQVSNDPEFAEGVVTVGTKVEPGEFGSDLDVTVNLDIGYRYVRLASMNSAVVSELEVYGDAYIKPERIINSYPDIKGTQLDGMVQLLQYLEIIDLGSAKSFEPDTVITRAEACEALLKLTGLENIMNPVQLYDDVPAEHTYAAVIAACNKIGMVNDAQYFYPDNLISPTDFLKMLEVMMGYKLRIEQLGGYPVGVGLAAREIGLYVGGDEYLNRETMVEILYSALDAKLMTTVTNGLGMTSAEGRTLIETYYGINIYKGKVTQNSVTSLTQPDYSGKIIISGNGYVDEWGEIDGLLGRNIYYITAEDDPEALLYYWEDVKRNDILAIKSRDIVGYDAKGIKYFEGDSAVYASVSGELSVILNGVAYNGWTYDDFKSDEAFITLIDSDKDGIYETALIDRPQVIINRASFGDDTEVVIKSKNNADLSVSKFEKIIVHKNGRVTNIGSAEENNLILAYVSADKKNVSIEIFTDSVTSVIEGTSSEGITLDGKEYLYSDYYKNNIKVIPELGKMSTIIFNEYDEVIYIMEETDIDSQTRQLGFIAAVSADPDDMEGPKLKIFVKDGVIKQERYQLDSSRIYDIDVVASGTKIYGCASKVKVDGHIKSHNDICNMDQSALLYKMAYFKTNANGLLTEIDLESNNTGAELERMNVTLDGGKDVFMVSIGGIFRYNQMLFPLNADIPVFVIPTSGGVPVSGNEYDDMYSVSTARSVFGNYALINFTSVFYEPDEFGAPAFALRYKEISELTGNIQRPINNDGAATVIVDSVYKKLDENGEECYCIKGINISTGVTEDVLLTPLTNAMYDGFKMTRENPGLLNADGYAKTLTGSNLTTYTVALGNIKRGDLIRYTYAGSRDGTRAAQLERVFTYENTPIASYTSNNGAFRSMSIGGYNYPATKFRMTYGAADLYNGDTIKLKLASGEEEVINLAGVYKFYAADKDKLTALTRYNFTDYLNDNARVVTIISNYGYVALIAYQY